MASRLLNSPNGYGWLSIFLHWVTVLLVVGLFVGGVYMVELTYYDKLYHILPEWHKAAGLLLCALTLLRLVWLLVSRPPHLLSAHGFMNALARLVHGCMYAGLFVLFVSGYIITTADGSDIHLFQFIHLPAYGEWSSEQADLFGEIHQWGAYGFMALAAVHGAAALFHHFVVKDATLMRMIKPNVRKPNSN